MPQQMTKYTIVFVNNETREILAEDLEDAAWTAYDLSYALDLKLKDIIPTHVQEEILSQQMETN